MARSADTYLKAKQHLGTMANVDDIRWTDEEKDDIRQEFLTCFVIARRAQRITEEQNTNPSFSTVEEVMRLMMRLEERAREARQEMCQFLQHGPGHTHDRRFHDEVTNIRDITEVAVKTSISRAREFLQNINDVDGTFALHRGDCDEIIGKMNYYTKLNREGEQPSNTALTTLVNDLTKRYESMKSAWSKIIQCAIDNENPTVFHEISVRVWATGDLVDEAITEAKRTINSQDMNGEPQVDKRHIPTRERKKTEAQTKIEITAGIDDESVEPSAEKREMKTTQRSAKKMAEAIEQIESAKTATHGNVTHAGGGEKGARESSNRVNGAEGGTMVARSGRSQTNGREESDITEKPKGEERPEARERAYTRELEIRQKSRAEERQNTEEQSRGEAEILKISEPPEEEKHAVGKRESAIEEGGRSEKERKREPPREAESTAETEWSAVRNTWNEATTCLPDEQGTRNAKARLEMAETMSRQVGNTTDETARIPGKSDREGRIHRPERITADCAGDFQSKKWLNLARYIWQPGTGYITSGKTNQWFSQQPNVKESRPENKKEYMARQFDPADFLDDPVNEHEAWARRITCEYTFSEILAATEERIGGDDNGKETHGTRTTKADESPKESDGGWADWKEAIDNIDVNEIRDYAENAFRGRGERSTGTQTIQDEPDTKLQAFADLHPTNRKGETAQNHKGKTHPDKHGQVSASSDDPDCDSINGIREYLEGATDAAPPERPNTEDTSRFEGPEESEDGIATYAQQNEAVDVFIKNAAATAITLWNTKINPQNKAEI